MIEFALRFYLVSSQCGVLFLMWVLLLAPFSFSFFLFFFLCLFLLWCYLFWLCDLFVRFVFSGRKRGRCVGTRFFAFAQAAPLVVHYRPAHKKISLRFTGK